MDCLERAVPQIQKLLSIITHTPNVEAAVFTRDCRLIAYTPKYIKHKGRQVHAPSLEEVFTHDDILVNKPGHMASCQGCRFREACPATVELLHAIKLGGQPIGVISLTAFNVEGQKRITKHSETYQAILRDISDLIAALAPPPAAPSAAPDWPDALRLALDTTPDCIFFINSAGAIIYSNPAAAQFFPQCFAYPKLLVHLLPPEVWADVLDGGRLTNRTFKTANMSACLSSLPLKNGSRFIGAIITLTHPHSGGGPGLPKAAPPADAFDKIIGDAAEIAALKHKAQKIAAGKATVMITGETGTGKELLARAIHQTGRPAFPFVAVNCAAIPENLFESELFGYEEGAFTGAKKGGKPGLIELANRGTLFLDEIGDLPVYMQAKLLRVLQDQTITRVGAVRPFPVDIRVIAATNQDLAEKVANREFRLDLYYRLNVIPLHLPALRRRKADIAILANHLLRRYDFGNHIRGFSPETLALFNAYDWPGNIRELENVVEHAVNLETGPLITPDSLPPQFFARQPAAAAIKERLASVEQDAIRAALDQYGWDLAGKTRAARELGIAVRTLYRKLNDGNNHQNR